MNLTAAEHLPISTDTTPIEAETRMLRSDGIVVREVAGECLLVPTAAGEVDLDSLFLLNEVGLFIWERLDGHLDLNELAAAVADEFEVAAPDALRDVTAFLEDLRARRLVESADSHAV